MGLSGGGELGLDRFPPFLFPAGFFPGLVPLSDRLFLVGFGLHCFGHQVLAGFLFGVPFLGGFSPFGFGDFGSGFGFLPGFFFLSPGFLMLS